MSEIVDTIRAWVKFEKPVYDSREAYVMMEKAADEIEELQKTFDLRWDADMRAIKRWREANPGNELVMPDHADLVVWLLEQLEATRSSDFHRDAVREIYEQSAQAIEDYDRREAAGEDVSKEVRPRLPGGSDF